MSVLGRLPVKGRAPKTGYSRDQFGPAWADDVDVDAGRNGCDTRNDVLRRDLTIISLKPGSNGCVVDSGTLRDVYTASTLPFTRSASAGTQIDHVVSLSDAWQTGAQLLTPIDRRNLANDPIDLQTTGATINQQKGDGDAATWLPPNKAYRCTYVARQVNVKAQYRLWVTAAERDAMLRVLGACGATISHPSAAHNKPTGNNSITAPHNKDHTSVVATDDNNMAIHDRRSRRDRHDRAGAGRYLLRQLRCRPRRWRRPPL